MSIEQLATQGRDHIHGGLAAIDTAQLRQMRNQTLRSCFTRFEETHFRLELVARIHGKDYINDAAARSVNATWYALQNTEGPIIWIAFGGDSQADYTKLRPIALRKVHTLICVGSDTQHLHHAFRSVVPEIRNADSLGAAVHAACYSLLENAKVLFSPATRQGLSDETAGQLFRHEVNEL